MKIQLHGYGKMGRMVERLAIDAGHTIAAQGDVSIDFSAPEGVIPNLKKCVENKIPVVIGTTGWEKWIDEAKEIAAEGTALYAPNFSLGVAAFRTLIEKAIDLLPHADRAGLEVHHKQKLDTPSGTAREFSETFEIPFTSLRIGTVIGKHEVMLETTTDRITLTHEAKNREGFALGAIRVAEWIRDQKGWLTLDDYLHCSDYTLSRG